MAGPDVLCDHAVEALRKADVERYKKILRHPRWNPDHAGVGSVVFACLKRANALELLQALQESGVTWWRHHQGQSVMGMATETMKADVVEWLLEGGRSLPWEGSSGSPLCLLLEAFSRHTTLSQDKADDEQASVQESACRIGRLFYRKSETFTDLVGVSSFERFSRGLGTPGVEQIWKALAEEGWDVCDPDDETRSFFHRFQQEEPAAYQVMEQSLHLARSWQREAALDAAMPAASVRGPKLRF